MNLHRVHGNADWSDVALTERNRWQRIAAATSGIVTIGNFFSLVGLLSVPLGLWLAISAESYLWASVVLALGRFCDLLDGWLADITGTKSPLGEKIDASFDKVSVAVTFIGLAMGGILPLWLAFVLLVPHVIIAVIATAAYALGLKLHPSRIGKGKYGVGMGSGAVYSRFERNYDQ